jgi:hypothetical protein
MNTYRRTTKAKGWGSPSGGIPYMHYRSLGGFYAPGDEPKDCPEENTLIWAIIDINREHGKTVTTRKARAIYEDCRSKDKELHRQRRALESMSMDARTKRTLIDEIDDKITFKRDTDTRLTSGYPVRAQSISHGSDPDENTRDHYRNGRRQRYKHLDGVPKEELLCEMWLLDFVAGEEDCERSDVERRFDSSRRIGAIVPCKVKGWWRGQNGEEPSYGKIQKYRTVGGDWIGPTDSDSKEARWQEYMRFYGTMPHLKRVFDSIYDCPILKWTIDRAVELGMMVEDAVDDPYEWAKAYLNRALNCVQVEAHKCFRKVQGYYLGRQHYTPGAYRWLTRRFSSIEFFPLPDLWEGANAEQIFYQSVACGDVLVWEDRFGIKSAIGIDRYNYGCEVWEINRQRDEFWRRYASATFETLEDRAERKRAFAKAESDRIVAKMKADREAGERVLVASIVDGLDNSKHIATETIVSLPHKVTNEDGDGMSMRITSELNQYGIELPSWGWELVFHTAVELGLLVYERDGYHGRDTKRPRSGFGGKATIKKPTLEEVVIGVGLKITLSGSA